MQSARYSLMHVKPMQHHNSQEILAFVPLWLHLTPLHNPLQTESLTR